MKILAGLRSSFEGHHSVRYTPDAIKSAVELSARYIHDRKLPDKAIDVIDEVGAMQMLVPPSRRKKVITPKEIEAVVRDHGADPAEIGVERRQARAREPGGGPQTGRLRPGYRDRKAGKRDEAFARRASRSRQADRQLSIQRPEPGDR